MELFCKNCSVAPSSSGGTEEEATSFNGANLKSFEYLRVRLEEKPKALFLKGIDEEEEDESEVEGNEEAVE